MREGEECLVCYESSILVGKVVNVWENQIAVWLEGVSSDTPVIIGRNEVIHTVSEKAIEMINKK